MTRKSLWNDFDGIKVAVYPPHPPYFAMEMGFKCGRTEIEYKAALGLRQSPSSLYYYLIMTALGNRLDEQTDD